MSTDEVLDKVTKQAAKTIWSYMKMNQKLKAVDLIFVLGSRDERVASYAADLYKQGYGKNILISGGIGHKNDLLATSWNGDTEAEYFANIIQNCGVSLDDVILENKSQNTGENIRFGYKVLELNHYLPKSIILVQKPYMERRTYATFMKQWPGKSRVDISVTSPPIKFENYFNEKQPMNTVINIMVGDLQRIIKYPSRGFQVYQKVPKNVINAYDKLVNLGYNKYLLQQ